MLTEGFFWSIVGDCIEERETRKFEEGLHSKVKLLLYKTFNEVVEFYIRIPTWSE